MKIPTRASDIQKLAHKEYTKKSTRHKRTTTDTYRDGDGTEKVWDNYQLTKQLKRDFKDLCAKENIIASKYLRACIKLLISKKGDVKKALKAVEKLDSDNLA